MQRQYNGKQQKPTHEDARWAFECLPLFYDFAFALERRKLTTAYVRMSELCHEIDRMWATGEYLPPETKTTTRKRTRKT